MHRVIKRALVSAAVLGPLSLGLSATASASVKPAVSPACSGDPAGFCGGEINVYGNAWTVGSALVNSEVTASPASVTTTGGDWIATDPAGSTSVRTFQWAPADVASGLCLSEPSAAAGSVLVLRPCRAASSALVRFQEFTGVNPGDTSGTPWVNVASGLTVQPNGTGNPLRAVKVLTNRAGSFWGWNAPAVVPPVS